MNALEQMEPEKEKKKHTEIEVQTSEWLFDEFDDDLYDDDGVMSIQVQTANWLQQIGIQDSHGTVANQAALNKPRNSIGSGQFVSQRRLSMMSNWSSGQGHHRRSTRGSLASDALHPAEISHIPGQRRRSTITDAIQGTDAYQYAVLKRLSVNATDDEGENDVLSRQRRRSTRGSAGSDAAEDGALSPWQHRRSTRASMGAEVLAPGIAQFIGQKRLSENIPEGSEHIWQQRRSTRGSIDIGAPGTGTGQFARQRKAVRASMGTGAETDDTPVKTLRDYAGLGQMIYATVASQTSDWMFDPSCWEDSWTTLDESADTIQYGSLETIVDSEPATPHSLQIPSIPIPKLQVRVTPPAIPVAVESELDGTKKTSMAVDSSKSKNAKNASADGVNSKGTKTAQVTKDDSKLNDVKKAQVTADNSKSEGAKVASVADNKSNGIKRAPVTPVDPKSDGAKKARASADSSKSESAKTAKLTSDDGKSDSAKKAMVSADSSKLEGAKMAQVTSDDGKSDGAKKARVSADSSKSEGAKAARVANARVTNATETNVKALTWNESKAVKRKGRTSNAASDEQKSNASDTKSTKSSNVKPRKPLNLGHQKLKGKALDEAVHRLTTRKHHFYIADSDRRLANTPNIKMGVLSSYMWQGF